MVDVPIGQMDIVMIIAFSHIVHMLTIGAAIILEHSGFMGTVRKTII